MRTHTLRRSPARLALPVLALLTVLTACSDIRSIQPAIDTASAILAPGLEGRWTHPDTAILEIRRSLESPRAYVVGLQDLTDTTQQSPAARGDGAEFTWLDARVGRLGGHLVLELSPARHMDSTLNRVMDNYFGFVLELRVVVGFEVSATELRISFVNADSVATFAPPLLGTGACASPYAFVGRNNLLLTGSSAEVRTGYDCLFRRLGFKEALVYTRLPR